MKKTIIIKLNKEAEDYANQMYRQQVRSQIPGQVWEEGHIAWLDLVYERFAELIVKECADFVAAGEFGDSGTAKELKEHFGVEE
jgi:hypothetical protein